MCKIGLIYVNPFRRDGALDNFSKLECESAFISRWLQKCEKISDIFEDLNLKLKISYEIIIIWKKLLRRSDKDQQKYCLQATSGFWPRCAPPYVPCGTGRCVPSPLYKSPCLPGEIHDLSAKTSCLVPNPQLDTHRVGKPCLTLISFSGAFGVKLSRLICKISVLALELQYNKTLLIPLQLMNMLKMWDIFTLFCSKPQVVSMLISINLVRLFLKCVKLAPIPHISY